MAFLCSLELHRWRTKPATFNPQRLVHRCRICGRVKVTKINALSYNQGLLLGKN